MPCMDDTATINPAQLAAAERRSQPLLLNEGQAAALLGVSRRKFHDVRQQPSFVEVCAAVELGPRALRWHRAELLAAAMNAPRRVKQAEPPALAAARERKTKALA